MTKKTILLLDDEPIIAMDLKFAVEDAGFAAVTAADNAAATAHINEREITAAILDVNLGGGETCAPTAKALIERAVPFLLHTGDLDRVGEKLRAIEAPVLAKPCPSEDVVARLLKLIGARA